MSILNVRYIRVAACDTEHHLVDSNVRERLAVSKQTVKAPDVGKFNLWKLNELEIRRQYQTEISNRFASLENLNDNREIRVNRVWENIKENIKTSNNNSLFLKEFLQCTRGC